MPSDSVCNGILDCEDKSDEQGCSTLLLHIYNLTL